MIVLAIDTAGTGCFAAVYDSERETVPGVAGADIGKGHAEKLMGFIDEALAMAGLTLEAIDRVAVTVGPGSFTGIRVGVAAARGFALALSIPCVGITTLQARAEKARAEVPGKAHAIVFDAKRDEVYLQIFEANGVARTKPEALTVSQAQALLAGFDGVISGSGRALVSAESSVDGDDRADIGIVARLGAEAAADKDKPRPLYLRGPDAKPQAGFAVARA